MTRAQPSSGDNIFHSAILPMHRPRVVRWITINLLVMFAAFLFSVVQAKDAVNELVTVNVTAPANQLQAIGSSFSVPITTSDLSFATVGTNVISYQFVMTYDQNVIIPQDPAVSVTGTISANGSVTINDLTPGVLEVTVFRASPLVGAGTLFNFKFMAVGTNNQTSPLTFTTFMFNEGNPDDNVANGLVKLFGPTAAGASVSGSVVGPGGRPVSSVRVTLTDNAGVVRYAITNPFGFYAFDDVPTGSVYVVNATSKRFMFQQRVITLLDDLAGIDLVAEP